MLKQPSENPLILLWNRGVSTAGGVNIQGTGGVNIFFFMFLFLFYNSIFTWKQNKWYLFLEFIF